MSKYKMSFASIRSDEQFFIFKNMFHPIKVLSSFIHLHVVLNLDDLLWNTKEDILLNVHASLSHLNK